MKFGRPERHFPRDMLFLFGLQVIGPAIVLIIVGCFLPVVLSTRQGDLRLFWIALVLAVTGLLLLFIARLPLYRQGKYFTFGSKALPEGRRRMYRIAYVFIGLSAAIMLLLLALLK